MKLPVLFVLAVVSCAQWMPDCVRMAEVSSYLFAVQCVRMDRQGLRVG